MIKINWANVSDFKTTLSEKIKMTTEQLLIMATVSFLDIARDLAPFDTGNLKNSGAWYIEGNTGIVIFTAVYAPHQEYGTVFMVGSPFLRPAADTILSMLKDMYKEASANV